MGAVNEVLPFLGIVGEAVRHAERVARNRAAGKRRNFPL